VRYDTHIYIYVIRSQRANAQRLTHTHTNKLAIEVIKIFGLSHLSKEPYGINTHIFYQPLT
jgi:hypothetical protein